MPSCIAQSDSAATAAVRAAAGGNTRSAACEGRVWDVAFPSCVQVRQITGDEIAAGQGDGHFAFGQPAPHGMHCGGASTRAAGARDPGSAFPYAQPDMSAVEDCRDVDVNALGKQRIGLDLRADGFERYRVGILNRS